MALSFRSMASGPGWSVSDIVCTAGPHDRPFEEQHAAVCIAAVTQGTFQYRATSGAAILATGAVLLGNEGTCFECRHEHGTGDRCLSFHVDSDLMEGIVAAVPGAKRTTFARPNLPPLPELMPLLAADAASCVIGTSLDEATLKKAAAAAVAIMSPAADARGPVEYRKHVGGVMVTRALTRAAARAS